MGPAPTRLARPLAATTAAIFLTVGILGFIPAVTSNVDQLAFAGHDSRAELFGIFRVSVLHNLVHLAFGVVGLAMATGVNRAMAFLTGGSLIYFVLWIYGFSIDLGSDANFVPLDTADNWLHLILAVGMLCAGLLLLRDPREP